MLAMRDAILCVFHWRVAAKKQNEKLHNVCLGSFDLLSTSKNGVPYFEFDFLLDDVMTTMTFFRRVAE